MSNTPVSHEPNIPPTKKIALPNPSIRPLEVGRYSPREVKTVGVIIPPPTPARAMKPVRLMKSGAIVVNHRPEVSSINPKMKVAGTPILSAKYPPKIMAMAIERRDMETRTPACTSKIPNVDWILGRTTPKDSLNIAKTRNPTSRGKMSNKAR